MPLLRNSSSQAPYAVGSVIGDQWRVLEALGSGELTRGYLVEAPEGRRATLRALRPELAKIPELTERFLRDPLIANQIKHPGCRRVLDTGLHEGTPYLVSDLVGGVALSDLLEAGQEVSPAQCLSWMGSALEVLDVAHGQAIIHRDLRPQSLVVLDSGELCIRDFGFARLRELGGEAASLAFVAPERLSHGTGAMDERGDLFALGAICFRLLTGETPLARGSTIAGRGSFERPSFAQLLPEAPIELAELVDRALMRDPELRYQSAAAMYRAVRRAGRAPELAELGRFASSVRQLKGAVAQTERPADGRDVDASLLGTYIPGAPRLPDLSSDRPSGVASRAASIAPAASSAPAPGGRGGGGDELGGSAPGLAPVTDHEVLALRQVFADWERALRAEVQYGAQHPEAVRAHDRAWAAVDEGLAASDGALLCNLTPYAFVLADQAVWEPKGSFARIPYRLFADGVRVLGLRRGLERHEWDQLSACLLSDLDEDPLHDFTTLLWDADLAHVTCQTVDIFVEGDGDARAEFESVRNQVAAVARFDTGMQLQDCWEQLRGSAVMQPSGAADGWRSELEASLGANERALPDVLAQEAGRAAEVGRSLEKEREPGVNRYVYVASSGLMHAVRAGTLEPMLVQLERCLSALARTAPLLRLEFALGLVEIAGRDATLRGTLIARVLTPELLLSALMELDALPDEQRGLLWARLGRILDASHSSTLCEGLCRVASARLKRDLLAQLLVNARGSEAALGAAILAADLAGALALVRGLGGLKSDAGRAALLDACRHLEPIVRLEALAALGASSERVSLELKQLLEDPSDEVRLGVLHSVGEHEVKAVGPALALRIRSELFDSLSRAERELALATLEKLLPSRAADIALELLGRSQLVTTRAHDESRELAAELLGRVGAGAPALEALQREVGRRFRNSERVREAASRAIDTVRQRTVTGDTQGDS